MGMIQINFQSIGGAPGKIAIRRPVAPTGVGDTRKNQENRKYKRNSARHYRYFTTLPGGPAPRYNLYMPEAPQWLKKQIGASKAALRSLDARRTDGDISCASLHTVCLSARCPNRGKCFSAGDATFLILGDICTRGCRFCAVGRGKPLPPEPAEPEKIAATALKWKLRYAVITSPTRDDLTDGGAGHFARTVAALRQVSPAIKTELLVPDFAGSTTALATVLSSRLEVLAHNVETVPQLYSKARAGADYKRSLALLEAAAKAGALTKSGYMVGLGETKEQLKALTKDLGGAGCKLLSVGQYLSPSKQHCAVEKYYEPPEFEELAALARENGIPAVLSGPLVRSSYKAGELYRQYLSK